VSRSSADRRAPSIWVVRFSPRNPEKNVVAVWRKPRDRTWGSSNPLTAVLFFCKIIGASRACLGANLNQPNVKRATHIGKKCYEFPLSPGDDRKPPLLQGSLYSFVDSRDPEVDCAPIVSPVEPHEAGPGGQWRTGRQLKACVRWDNYARRWVLRPHRRGATRPERR
jgi:hypothetical protein